MALVRYPGLLAAVVVGALLLSLVAAAYPLFLSRSEGELLESAIANPTITPYGAGMFYSVTNVRFGEKVRARKRRGARGPTGRGVHAARGRRAASRHRPVRYALGCRLP